MRILLSDGSGLTARQVATQLSTAGHTVEVLSPDPIALTRFTRHVRRVHRVPPYGDHPFVWLEAALSIYSSNHFDVLLPTQEQVAVLSRCSDRLLSTGVSCPVPSFVALKRVQDKLAASETLTGLGLAQPETHVVTSATELAAWDQFPIFVKTPIGTASSGVAHVAHQASLVALAGEWNSSGVFESGGVLVQTPAEGPLTMIQSVFSSGRLLAFHANLRVREGAGGGASHKRSIVLPEVREDLVKLGGHLGWHGALSVDAILTETGPLYIDVNPRLVEPGNAWRAGVDLVTPLLQIAHYQDLATQQQGAEGIATHQLMLAVLGAAQHRHTRRAICSELFSALTRRGSYRGSAEELTPVQTDLRTVIPVAVASLATLVSPDLWQKFSSGAVSNYALTPGGWHEILECGSGC